MAPKKSAAKKAGNKTPGNKKPSNKKPFHYCQGNSHQRDGSVPLGVAIKTGAAGDGLGPKKLCPQEVDSYKIVAATQLAAIRELAVKEEILLKEKIGITSTSQSETDEDFKNFLKPSKYPRGLKFPTGNIGRNSLIETANLFTCPKIGPDVLPEAKMKARIREYLRNLPKDDVGNTYLPIHSLNKPEQIAVCVETLRKILWNIMVYPRKTTYQRIRLACKTFQSCVARVEGASEFLSAVGFTKKLMKNENSGLQEMCWVFSTDEDEEDFIKRLSDIWHNLPKAEPVIATVYRNIKMLSVDQVDPELKPVLPPDFFHPVRYSLIRIKFPDGHILQGTFSSEEKLRDVYAFVRDSLSSKRETTSFLLRKYKGSHLDEMDATMSECGLAPAAILTFKDLSVSAKVDNGRHSYIRTKILRSALTSS